MEAVTSGMVGHGFYNRNSATQWAAIEAVLPWLEQAIAEMDLAEPPAAVGIADFGCSEGRNSLAAMARLIPAVRARAARPIQTVHGDLPTNDFSALLRDLRSGGESSLGAEVFSTVVGGSMYHQLLPPRSLHLAMTFNAIAFFSRRPLDRLPGYILPNGPSAARGVGEVTEAERAVFAAQAQADMESFLAARARELVPGGKLLIEVFGRGNGLCTADGIYDALNDAVGEVLHSGAINRAAYEAYYQPIYLRSLDELVAPVTGGGALEAQFRLERAETRETPVPFVGEFRRTGDAAVFARRYTDFFRAFTEAVIRAAFARPDIDALVDDIYARAERLIRDTPERYPLNYVSVSALLTRLDTGAP